MKIIAYPLAVGAWISVVLLLAFGITVQPPTVIWVGLCTLFALIAWSLDEDSEAS